MYCSEKVKTILLSISFLKKSCFNYFFATRVDADTFTKLKLFQYYIENLIVFFSYYVKNCEYEKEDKEN